MVAAPLCSLLDEPLAEGFGDGLLGSEARGEVGERIRLRLAVVQFNRREGPTQEGGVASGELPDAPDLHHVDADADDHR